jgi:MFS transporter, DHA1 family, multidrug resistance protein
VAPITGGWLLAVLGWRSIFVFLALYASLLILAILRWLPETLPLEKRQSLHPVHLARSYLHVFSNPAFLGQSGALAANFLGFFLYVLSAPVFLMTHLGVSAQGFGWLFVPTVTGMMLGSWWSSRLAGQCSPVTCVRLSFAIMLMAATVNVVLNAFFAAQLPWSVLPIMLYTFGMAIGTPALQLLIIDLYPKQRGLVASCQSFMQSSGNVLGAAVLAPLLWATPLQLAAGMASLVGLGLALFLLGYRRQAPQGAS